MRPASLGAFFAGAGLALSGFIAPIAWAGGSGLNVAVIANLDSSNSCEVANYYCEQRGIPPGNVLFIDWTGGNTSWDSDDFESCLLSPLLDMLASRQLTNQVTSVVLSMDIPFETISSADGTINSTTSALFYGVRTSSGAWGFTNSYAFSEAAFGAVTPVGSPGYSFLATMITGDSLAEAEQVVDQGVGSDGTFPLQPVVLAKSSDTTRNIRYLSFDNAIFNVNVLGAAAILRTNSDTLPEQGQFLGYETGLENFTVPAGAFVPGAMADSLTSFGGIIFGANDQTTVLALTAAGAAGSYGTVAEPGTDTQKFPDPQDYFYQSRGFSLSESYYQSINVPYLGLIVGEPLAAPFQQVGWGAWGVTNANPVLHGVAALPVSFVASDNAHPLQQIDLFIDGVFFSTVTKLAPSAGNLLTVSLNGYPVTYSVPANATLPAIASGLAAALNAPAVSNITGVAAYPYGDRVELHLLSTNPVPGPFYFTDATATNAVLPFYQTELLPTSFPPQLSLAGRGRGGFPKLQINTLPNMPVVIQASSDLANWLPVCNCLQGGPLVYSDPEASGYDRRFYRASWSTDGSWLAVGMPPSTAPEIAAQRGPGAGGALLQIASSVWPYIIESSTDGTHWAPLYTNLAVGQVQAAVTSSIGSGSVLTTFLATGQPTFMKSAAFGLRECEVPSTSLMVGAWIALTITKTNGAIVVVGVTNQVSGTSSTNLAAQLCNAINATPALQGSDGVTAEDFTINAANMASFNLLAGSPGLQAAGIQVANRQSGVIFLASAGSLTQNLSSLQPRSHLYVTTGATALGARFRLDTTRLADGFHELTAVAYEGSDVRTQTSANLAVQVQNSSLTANLTLLDLTNGAPVGGTYHIQVAANTNAVSTITLYSTGGALDSITNAPAATFGFGGATLGAGLHPFYAVVEAADGTQYRTGMQWVRLSEGQ